MDKILTVYLGNSNTEAGTELALLASPYELLDAMDKLRLEESEKPYWEITEWYGFKSLVPLLTEDCDFYELNALTEKLSNLDEWQSSAFGGLVQMDIGKKDGAITLPRLIDLAVSADCCHVVPEVTNDEQLGKFYVDGGFLPEYDDLPEKVLAYLDYAKIGREQRITEGGVLTDGGYVVQHADLVEAYRNMDFTPKTPEYQILLEAANCTQICLPTKEPLPETFSRCLDCRVPVLAPLIERETKLSDINAFAAQLAELKGSAAITYKAMMESIPCNSLEQAVQLMEQTDYFILDRRISSPREMSLSELRLMVGDGKHAALLTKYVDITGYGRAVLERDNAIISEYGHLLRDDYQPFLAPLEQRNEEGMEMR